MIDFGKIVEIAIGAGKAIASDENITEFLCGTYADGTKRSLADAIQGEYLSPKQKKKITSKKKKKPTKFKL